MSIKRLIRKYSPIYIAAFIIIFAAIGAMLYQSNRTYNYNGRQYRVGESFSRIEGCNTCSFDENGQLLCTKMACDSDGLPPDETLNIEFSYSNGKYIYSGTIQKPTPCHEVKSEIVVRESFPEQVDLRFMVKDSGQICTQVIGEEAVTGEIQVSKEASIRVFLNDKIQTEQGINN